MTQSKSVHWECRPTDGAQVAALALELDVTPTVARVLINRKITTSLLAQNFFHADLNRIHGPELMQGMTAAVARVSEAILKEQKICIYGDYDVDGAVATTLLVAFFEELGTPVEFYIPNRLLEGYSLNSIAVDRIHKNGVNLIITVDNGIMAHDAVAYANTLGIDVIVTDHHRVGDTLPQAVAVVNPQRRDCTYPFKGICGAGVAFKLMVALRQHLRVQSNYFQDRPVPNLKSYFDLLCIPTVCDVVPLTGENRIFVQEGLKHIANTKRPGIKALLKVCKLDGHAVTAHDLGFKLGPRINACGRLEDASLGVRMLLSKDSSEALVLANRLDALNQERRELERGMAEEAFAKITTEFDLTKTLGVVLFEPSWHIGVVGIVASRLVEKIHRPVFVLAEAENGLIKGSGRSAAGVSLISALGACSEGLVAFGGHEAAAGVTLPRDQVATFTKNFDAAVKMQITADKLQRKLWVDDELHFDQINERLLTELEKLEPFGAANAKPLFASRHLQVRSQRVVGDNHLKLKLASGKQSFDAIAFNITTLPPGADQDLGLIFSLEFNHFNGQKTIQLVVKSFF